MASIHDRMPVILDPATFDRWLDPANEDTEELRALLRPPPAGTVAHHPVGPRIGNVRNNDATLMEPA
jgi:putative SOS response-associated peptidase YedK